jgi:hypothetical protein
MHVVPMKEARLIVAMDDMDFGIRDVAFEAKMFNRYGTFDQIRNRSMEDPNYAYLHCDLLNKVTLTIITLKAKSSYIEIHKQHLHKGMFVKVEFFCIESKSKMGFGKNDTCCHYY